MKVIDLSHVFKITDDVFPGTGKMSQDRTHTVERDGYNLTLVTVNSHAGTHTDAPLHFLAEGKSLAEVEINRYVGTCFVVPVAEKDRPNSMIELDNIKPYEDQIIKAGRVAFSCGWYKKFGEDNFFTEYPSVSVELAKWLVSLGVKMIGVEGPSLSTIAGEEVHHILLENNVAVVESLANLDQVAGKEILFCGAPLAFEGMDGFPIRAYALEGIK